MEFLLVHGEFHNADHLAPLTEELRSRGHTVHAPHLPGHGPGDTKSWGQSQKVFAEAIADVARSAAEPVHAMGHSMGGVVISNAAEIAPDAFASLTYLAGFLLPSGRGIMSVTSKWKEDVVNKAVKPNLIKGSATFPADKAIELFYSGTPADLAQKAADGLVMEGIKTVMGNVKTTDANWGRVPRYYIQCSEDKAIPPFRQQEMIDQIGVTDTAVLASDHSPYLHMPDQVAGLLERFASSALATAS